MSSNVKNDTIATPVVILTLSKVLFPCVSKDTITLHAPITNIGGEVPATATVCAYIDSFLTEGEICADTVTIDRSFLLVGTLENLTPDICYYIKVTIVPTVQAQPAQWQISQQTLSARACRW